MTQTVVNGGTRTSQDQYVGAPNEVTADTSNAELRLHDGATPGGHRIPNLDTNDSRYQARTPEIDGLDFDPNAKGWLVRLSAGVYRLRKLVSGGGITIENPDGVAGNPTFGLAEEIPGDHKFLGDVIVAGVMQVDGGINADTSGVHTGDVVGDTAGSHVGNVDVRGKTLRLDDDQVPQSAVSGLAESLAGTNFPVGMIVMWSGTMSAIPPKWHLCDGTSGTPDLRGQFIVGAKDDDEILATVGSETHSHVVTAEGAGIHHHDIAVQDTILTIGQIPSHQHGNGVNDTNAVVMSYGIKAAPQTSQDIGSESHGNVSTQGITEPIGGGAGHTHGATSADAGNHTHVISMEPGSNIPPSVLLAYIMKIS